MSTVGTLILIAIVLGIIAFVGIIVLLVVKRWVKVAGADEALVISGRRQAADDGGGESNVTVVVNGRAVVNPVMQRAEVISLRSRQVSMTAEAQSKDNITLNVEAVALVKIGSRNDLVRRAAERFASQDRAIEVFTTEQLEGALRGVVAKLDVSELMRDRKKFSDEIAADMSTDLEEQGLLLDSFQIKGITDAVGYISSLGVPQIQAKREQAEVAEANTNRAIRKRQIEVDEENLTEETAFSSNKERANAAIGQERARAEQAEALANAQEEQAVLKQAASNREARLDADVRRVADAEKYRREQEAEAAAIERIRSAQADRDVAEREAEARVLAARSEADARLLRARADADAIRLEGEARAEAIRAEAEALELNRDALLAQKALDVLPEVMAKFAEGYASIEGLTIIGGGEGGGASTHLAGEQGRALASSFESIKAVTGIDLSALLQASVTGQAVGRGMSQGGATRVAPAEDAERHDPAE
ncbi:MAG: SPFH domain-containing protein [Mobilicoccus sp.]|nr:SPFH domain-containing protein [Mobilicoccus sp.]